MIDATQCGPLIAAYYASAGALLFAAIHGAILASSSPHIRAAWFYVAATVQVALFQLLCALQYTAPDLSSAVAAQKWVNAASLSIFPLVLGAAVFLAPSRRLVLSIWGMAVICVLLVAINFTMPYGLRFTDVQAARLQVLPWKERLFFLDGASAVTRNWQEILSFLVVLVGAFQARKVLKRGEGLSGRLVGLGAGLMLISLCFTTLSHRGMVAVPYVGGFAYTLFVLGLGLLVIMQIGEARAGHQRVFDRLIAEIDNHGETHALMIDLLHHDTLTALPNRAGMLGHLKDALEDSRRDGRQLLLMLIDIDHFDDINRELGHETGDALLARIGQVLREEIGEGGYVARVDGDEFVIAATDLGMACGVGLLFRNRAKMASLSFDLGNRRVDMTFSVGVASYPEDSQTVPDLLAAADLAMREAKRRGTGQMCFFRRDLSEESQRRIWLGNALREALAKQQFELFFQPQIKAADGRPVGMEALIRWRHPEEGLIRPDRFIPLAEEMQLIVEIGSWVIEEACRNLALWRKSGAEKVRVAVNLSARQLRQADLPAQVEQALERHGLAGEDFELEITESILMADPPKAIAQLWKLRDLGVRLSIDDFGTGYSSLSYLNQLPIDGLKLDRSFVSEIGSGGKGQLICAATLNLAATLGLETVAEGVEREVQADFLRDQGCDLLQGYLFSEPLPPDKAAEFLVRAAALSGGEG